MIRGRSTRQYSVALILLLPPGMLWHLPTASAGRSPEEPIEQVSQVEQVFEAERDPDDSEAESEAPELTIGQISVKVKKVFDLSDPGEDRWIFRQANRMHSKTRSSTIQERLLFDTGDRYSPRLLGESERLLRSERFLRDVEIRTRPAHDHQIDVEVITQDVWTLDLGVSVGRSGGTNSFMFEIQETNLLGTGKGLLLRRESNVDRSSLLVRFNDDHLLGTRARLLALVANNSDGDSLKLEIGRPFYALDTRWAAGVRLLEDERVDSLYELGEVSNKFGHKQSLFELYGGFSRGLVKARTHRWMVGITYQEDRFGPAEGLAPGAAVPEDRVLAYPWIALHSIQDRWVERRDMQQISRTEDLHVGRTYRFRLGLTSSWLGSDRTAALFNFSAATGIEPARNHTVLLTTEGSGRWATGGPENLLIGGGATYYWRNLGRQLFFVGVDGRFARNLDAENQLLLGGDSGLRGYPLRYQDGDRRALLTVEQRFFTNFYPLRLFHVGAAVFFDAGRTWPGDSSISRNLGWLKDIGIGLRLSPSRSGLGKMIHLDVAFPLDGGASIDSIQWLVRTKTSF